MARLVPQLRDSLDRLLPSPKGRFRCCPAWVVPGTNSRLLPVSSGPVTAPSSPGMGGSGQPVRLPRHRLALARRGLSPGAKKALAVRSAGGCGRVWLGLRLWARGGAGRAEAAGPYKAEECVWGGPRAGGGTAAAQPYLALICGLKLGRSWAARRPHLEAQFAAPARLCPRPGCRLCAPFPGERDQASSARGLYPATVLVMGRGHLLLARGWALASADTLAVSPGRACVYGGRCSDRWQRGGLSGRRDRLSGGPVTSREVTSEQGARQGRAGKLQGPMGAPGPLSRGGR